MGKPRIKKIKCPRCKRKIWNNVRAMNAGMEDCNERGMCGLEKIDQRLLPTVLPREPKGNDVVLEEDQYEFEISEPLMIHIVDATHRYTNENTK